jgi:hypothetical protein
MPVANEVDVEQVEGGQLEDYAMMIDISTDIL